MMAISSAQVRCPSAGRPVQLTKWVCSMPSSCARRFIRSTKASSVPAMCSASATEQSLADTTATAFTMSRTVICSCSFSQIWEPPMEVAWVEAVTVSSQLSAPLSMASMTSSRVMTLVTEAGSYCLVAFSSYKILPVVFSISTAVGADRPMGAEARAVGISKAAAARRAARIRFMAIPRFIV